jgi:hypothetical protein
LFDTLHFFAIVKASDFYSPPFIYSDIMALAKDRAYTHINLDEMTVQQVGLYFIFAYQQTSVF